MKKKSKLKSVSEMNVEPNPEELIRLLLKDHKAMRVLMKQIKSHRSTPAKVIGHFRLLEKLVRSHVKAEEFSLLIRVNHHPKFADHAKESIEEHHIHESVLKGIADLRDRDRKVTQMKIFCELLKDHIDEEEEDLFPKLKKYAALLTRKKMGTLFMARRTETRRKGERLGSLRT